MRTADVIEVRLVGDELQRAFDIGRQRQRENRDRNIAHRYGEPPDFDVADAVGAVGEAAVAKALGVEWDKGTWRAPDVADFQVRATLHRIGGLILHEPDGDDDVFILANIAGRPAGQRTAADPLAVVISGWTFGRDGKRPEYWAGWLPRPCYLVACYALRPLDELPIAAAR